jgi:hypothetical protein
MKCKICFNEASEKEWINTARIHSAQRLTDKPVEALSKRLTEWRPIETLGGVPGRNHKYRCPSCKSSKCSKKGGSGCRYYGEWTEKMVIKNE